MISLILGGSGSGKSEFAENLFKEWKGEKYYVATMKVNTLSGAKRIKRHEDLREGKGFLTIECTKDFDKLPLGKYVLLEDMGNFCANWLFSEEKERAEENIKYELTEMFEKSKIVVIVSNDVFSDGNDYDGDTLKYIELLGKINSWITDKADKVIEVVYSIPIYHKGEENV